VEKASLGPLLPLSSSLLLLLLLLLV